MCEERVQKSGLEKRRARAEVRGPRHCPDATSDARSERADQAKRKEVSSLIATRVPQAPPNGASPENQADPTIDAFPCPLACEAPP